MMAGMYVGLAVLLVSIITSGSAAPPADFVTQGKSQCYYRNGTEDILFLQRYIYNQEEFVYFDSDKKIFIAKTEFGRPEAEYWNSQPDILQQLQSAVERLCKHNYHILKPVAIDRKSEPRVKIISTKSPSQEYENILTCYVDNFFPAIIEVTWLKNDVEETSQVTSSELLDDGDWTYQIHVYLETTLERGDTFTCRVKHSSLDAPMSVHWKFEPSESARSKKLTGIFGFVLGAIFFIVGLVIYLRSRKGYGFLAVRQENPMS